MEGNLVNLDVTSPAATLALALMFLKTNDAGVAASFVIPDTHFALDYVRPNFILLRVLARALVLWDKLLPTEAWVQQQLPRLLRVIHHDTHPFSIEACIPHDDECLDQKLDLLLEVVFKGVDLVCIATYPLRVRGTNEAGCNLTCHCKSGASWTSDCK